MRNFLIGLVVGVLLVGLTLLVLVFAAIRFAGSYANRPVSVADGSTLVLDLEGDIPERLPAEIPIPILQSQRAMSVAQVWDAFRRWSTSVARLVISNPPPICAICSKSIPRAIAICATPGSSMRRARFVWRRMRD